MRIGFSRSFLFRACRFSEVIRMERIMETYFAEANLKPIRGIQHAVFLGSYETTFIDLMGRSGIRDGGPIEGDNSFFG
jgi:hypothetical protein